MRSACYEVEAPATCAAQRSTEQLLALLALASAQHALAGMQRAPSPNLVFRTNNRSQALLMWFIQHVFLPVFAAAPVAQEPARPAARVLLASAGAQQQQPQLAVADDGALALAFASGGTAMRVAVRPAGGDWQEPH